MKLHLLPAVLLVLAIARESAAAGPPIELELVTEQGMQITAPQQWLQLLTGIGIQHVQIRGGRSGDQPTITSRGSSQSASYKIVGVLSAADQLRLPGATFAKTDRSRLQDYFAKLSADGADAVTAPHGQFGLTEKELTAVLADLAQPIAFETKGLAPRQLLDRLQTKLSFKPSIDTDADQILRAASPAVDELANISVGTGLAIVLRNNGLVMRPEKQSGRPVVYRITVAAPEVLRARALGKMTSPDLPYWPIGWEPEKSPGEMAPALFQQRNAEIDGYSLEEALTAIGPLVKLPIYFDRSALTTHKIDPAQVQVKLAKTRTTYKRVIDRILSQSRLGSDIRVDEAGNPFVWITR